MLGLERNAAGTKLINRLLQQPHHHQKRMKPRTKAARVCNT
jgi:hypothetical protein